VKPLEVQVVAMDWKWLFFYPEQGIATVNELAAPVDRPILFKLTATSTMNAFYVPDLAGMIYAMPGMQTELNAVINKPGVFPGMSSHYSGAGFSGMTFKFHGLSDGDFAQWVQKAKAEGKPLDKLTYLNLAKPSERDPVQRFSPRWKKDLYDKVLNRCVEDGKMCMRHMMAIDARGRRSLREAAVGAEPAAGHVLGGQRPAGTGPPGRARPDHRRSQEDRHHVSHPGHGHAAARLRRCGHDACLQQVMAFGGKRRLPERRTTTTRSSPPTA
jgi:hypothetical protein